MVNNKQHLDQTYEAGDEMDNIDDSNRFPFIKFARDQQAYLNNLKTLKQK